MPNFEMHIPTDRLKVRFSPPEEVDEDIDEDDMDDEDDEDPRTPSSQRRQQEEFERIRGIEAQNYRMRKRKMVEPQIPTNPYLPPQPQYISVESVMNMFDVHFGRIEAQNMLIMTLLAVVLLALAVVGTLWGLK